MITYYLIAEGTRLAVGRKAPIFEKNGSYWSTEIGRVLADEGQFAVELDVTHDEVAEVGNLMPTPPEFQLLLTLKERTAIRQAGTTDTAVADLLSMLDDPRLTFVALENPGVIEAVSYLATTEPQLLTAERAARVLAGLPPLSGSS